MKSRIFNICQYEFNPITGEDLHFNETNIIQCIGHKTIKQYAYIKHDKDVCVKEDEVNGHKIGDIKPTHYHLVIRTDAAVEIDTIAKWLGIPPQYIDVPKGRGAFLDCIQYLTHEDEKQQKLGKHHYDDEEVKANFDFRKELNERAEKQLKYGKDLTQKQQILYDVMYTGKTIREVIAQDEVFYVENYQKVDSCRLKYIQSAKPPKSRINYYVCGSGGVGKDLLCRALARSLYPQYEEDDDIFFTIGAENATFEGYDGQPVIIWSDCRASDLITLLGGRGNIFKVFETHPSKQRQNVKYSSINLINEVNIVNSVQPYLEFLNGLAGEYTTKNGMFYKSEENEKRQSYRRFPIIIPIHENDFSILLNNGFLNGNEDFIQYTEHANIVGNMRRIHEVCRGNEELAKKNRCTND
jgi:hypothetical protein